MQRAGAREESVQGDHLMVDQKIPSDLFDGLTFRLARGAEREAALRLRTEVYETELPHHGMDEFDASAHLLVAFDTIGCPIAVSRVIAPEQRPFELEQYVDLAVHVPDRIR